MSCTGLPPIREALLSLTERLRPDTPDWSVSPRQRTCLGVHTQRSMCVCVVHTINESRKWDKHWLMVRNVFIKACCQSPDLSPCVFCRFQKSKQMPLQRQHGAALISISSCLNCQIVLNFHSFCNRKLFGCLAVWSASPHLSAARSHYCVPHWFPTRSRCCFKLR